jgi:hypothetical protein
LSNFLNIGKYDVTTIYNLFEQPWEY